MNRRSLPSKARSLTDGGLSIKARNVPQDPLTDELRVESFFPADTESAQLLHDLAAYA